MYSYNISKDETYHEFENETNIDNLLNVIEEFVKKMILNFHLSDHFI